MERRRLHSFRRIDKPPVRTIASKSVITAQQAEILIADKRAGLTPADMVEQRFQALLLHCSLNPGTHQLSLPRDGGHTGRTIKFRFAEGREGSVPAGPPGRSVHDSLSEPEA